MSMIKKRNNRVAGRGCIVGSGSFCGNQPVGNSEWPYLIRVTGLGSVSFRIAILTTLAILANIGCTPYVFAGLAYSGDAGYPHFVDESGLSGNFGVGVEFDHGISCEGRHRSMVSKDPEIVTNDYGCEYKKYFGTRR